MTKDAIRKIVEEALNISAVEEDLIALISVDLDTGTVAKALWDQYEDEIIEVAAEVAAESILPF